MTLSGTFLVAGGGTLLLLLIASWRSKSRQGAMYSDAIARFVGGSPMIESVSSRPAKLEREINAPAWYLSGVQALRAGRTRDAVRAFGIAHHADCELVTAALLTFAGLKTSSTPAGDLIHEIVSTWHEMKCPGLSASTADALMLSALQQTAPPAPAGSELAGFIWVVVGQDQRECLKQLINSGPEWTNALRE